MFVLCVNCLWYYLIVLAQCINLLWRRLQDFLDDPRRDFMRELLPCLKLLWQ